MKGQDNGLNAWMDSQLNHDEVDNQMKKDAKYAKMNSDTTRCFDIDIIPIRGPPKLHDLDSEASFRRHY